MLQPGEKVYIICHAYYHYCGEVIQVIPGWVQLKNTVQVIHCPRGWTRMFAEGFKDDTNLEILPNGGWYPMGLPIIPWPHSIPREK